MRDRLSNLLAVLATGLADEQRRATAAATGLSDSGVAAVIALAQFLGGARIGDVANVLGLSHSGAVRLVGHLVQGRIARRVGLSDGREVGVQLTERGRQLAEAAASARAAAADAVMSGLDEAQRAELEHLLGLLVAAHTRNRLERRARTDEPAAWLCRTCDLVACGRADGRCPAAGAVSG